MPDKSKILDRIKKKSEQLKNEGKFNTFLDGRTSAEQPKRKEQGMFSILRRLRCHAAFLE